MDENLLTIPGESATQEDWDSFRGTVLEKVPGLMKKVDIDSMLRIPGKDAGEEDIKTFHSTVMEKVPTLTLAPDVSNEESVNAVMKALGMPDETEGYKDADLTGFEDKEVNTKIMEAFKPIAQKAKLTQTQFNTIMKLTTEVNVNAAAEAKEKRDQEMGVLKSVWGSAFDNRVEAIKTFLNKTEASDEVKSLVQNASPAMMQWMYDLTVVASGKEGNDLSNDKTGKDSPLTPDEAQAQIDEIRNNKDHAYHSASNPGHAAARARMRKLYEMLPGGKDIVATS